MALYGHIIIGRGLAGIVLSEVLAQRGRSVQIIDQAKTNSASQVAAGSMNPVAMKRIILGWRATTMMEHAVRFYRELETKYQLNLLEVIPAERLHASLEEANLWKQRELEHPIGDHLEAGVVAEQVMAPHGSGRIPACYWLNVQALLKAHEQHWRAHIQTEAFNSSASADHSVIHCTGAFDELPGLVPVQGELLTLHIPGLNMSHSAHRSGFLIPLGKDLYRLGATFEWKDIWSGPSAAGKKQLLEKLARMIDLPFEVVEHWAGTRPTTKDRRPILGAHPKYKRHFVLNGLGSKGAMIVPWCATHLCDHMLEQQALDPEVDIARFQ